jgi:hypothetical protein
VVRHYGINVMPAVAWFFLALSSNGERMAKFDVADKTTREKLDLSIPSDQLFIAKPSKA